MGASSTGTFVAVTGQINDGIVTLPKLATGTAGKYIGYNGTGNASEQGAPAMSLISKTTYAAANTHTISVPSTYDNYMLVIMLANSQQAEIRLAANAIAGGNYIYISFHAGVGSQGSGDYFSLCTPQDTICMSGSLAFSRITNGANNIGFSGAVGSTGAAGAFSFLSGFVATAAANISSLTLSCSAGTLTGNVYLFGW